MAVADSTQEHVAGKWYSVPELRLRDHYFTVPLDYSLGDDESCSKITIFCREVVSAGKEEELELPYMLFLQGGPGMECPRPTDSSGWIGKACEEYRVILLDQRGTGLSTPLTPSSMLQIKPATELASYLKNFRADNIVRDAESVRVQLVPGPEPWTLLSQSFGGFCALTYLSYSPHGLKRVLITGGLPPVTEGSSADDVYRGCIDQVVLQNLKYYHRFPQDSQLIRDVVLYLAESGGAVLPSGGVLTSHGLQLLGLSGLGSSHGFERLHYMFERVWDPVLVRGEKKKKTISSYFLTNYEKWLVFSTNPLYAVLHESIYCQGSSSRWSAQRIRSSYGSQFDAVRAAEEGLPVFFTGEMVFPWMFEEISALRGLKEVANLLAEEENWPRVYDTSVLKNNKVPVAAAVYYDDMYVNFNLSMRTASLIGNIRLWVTNEYMHSGLRDDPSRVFTHLMSMLNGKNPLF